MRRNSFILTALTILAIAALFWGCDKEKIVQSTEYVHDTKYIEMPPDTIFMIDTVFASDTSIINHVDTVLLIDTVIHNTIIHDTIRLTSIVHDTVRLIDTVIQTQYRPSAPLAVEALQSLTNPLVLEFVASEYGYGDGWIFYLASEQVAMENPSTNVYDIYGYLEYWVDDWSDFIPLEYYWRVTYQRGDPSNPDNWEMTDPPSAISGHQPGIRVITSGETSRRAR